MHSHNRNNYLSKSFNRQQTGKSIFTIDIDVCDDHAGHGHGDDNREVRPTGSATYQIRQTTVQPKPLKKIKSCHDFVTSSEFLIFSVFVLIVIIILVVAYVFEGRGVEGTFEVLKNGMENEKRLEHEAYLERIDKIKEAVEG